MTDPVTDRTPRLGTFLFYSTLTLVLLVYSLPSLGVLLTSFKTTEEIARDGLWSWPQLLRFTNFSEAWIGGNLLVYGRNSLLVTLPATAASILLGILTGYVFSTLRFRGSDALFVLVVAGMFYPPQIVLIPLFRLFNALNLYDTLWPMIIVHTAFGIPICTLVLRNFFAAIPHALREAAILDGAHEGQVLTRVMLPLSLPALAVLATLQFTWIWNDFLWPIIFTQSDSMRTIMVGLASLKGQYSVAYGVQGALSILASLPTLLVFVFFQRYFIRGLTLGSVKG